MTDEEIIRALKDGDELTFGCNCRNTEVMSLMRRLEDSGLIVTKDASLSQETRRKAKWIGDQNADMLS